MSTTAARNGGRGLDPTQLPVIANRFEAIGREMTNTLLRSGRSAVLSTARDFSCTLVTADDRLLASSDGLPVHIFGSHLQTQAMRELHPDFREGDAYLHNDPYLGNTHHADHTILVPVFVEGTHMFTACAKAHQADIGNSLPSTYMPFARDIYEEGALVFPCTQIQRDYDDLPDVIRMARARIRVPDQWYGDYLAALGASRIAERRLKELVERYGLETIQAFVEEWFDYSERRIAKAISELPARSFTGGATHDPIPGFEEGIPLKVVIEVNPVEGMIEIDLRDNIDCIPAGLNQSEATAVNSVITGVFNVLDSDIPHNAGSFRRIKVHLRENCVVGIPRHPTCCSMATTNIADRLVNATQAAFADPEAGAGLAEGGSAMGVDFAVISGGDWRRDDAPFVNQIILGNNGGPGGPEADGWLSFVLPVAGGLIHRDSVEILEQKYPMVVDSLRLIPDGGGAGRHRGAPPIEVVYGSRHDTMFVAFAGDGSVNAPKGVGGGHDGLGAHAALRDLSTGEDTEMATIGQLELEPGQRIVGNASGGGGYGNPRDREPDSVRGDVLEGWVTRQQAELTYGVVLIGEIEDGSLAVDPGATAECREGLAGG